MRGADAGNTGISKVSMCSALSIFAMITSRHQHMITDILKIRWMDLNRFSAVFKLGLLKDSEGWPWMQAEGLLNAWSFQQLRPFNC